MKKLFIILLALLLLFTPFIFYFLYWKTHVYFGVGYGLTIGFTCLIFMNYLVIMIIEPDVRKSIFGDI